MLDEYGSTINIVGALASIIGAGIAIWQARKAAGYRAEAKKLIDRVEATSALESSARASEVMKTIQSQLAQLSGLVPSAGHGSGWVRSKTALQHAISSWLSSRRGAYALVRMAGGESDPALSEALKQLDAISASEDVAERVSSVRAQLDRLDSQLQTHTSTLRRKINS